MGGYGPPGGNTPPNQPMPSGYGQQPPGYGYYYAPPRPPSRSIDLGATLRTGWQTFKRRWGTFVGLGLLAMFVSVVVVLVAMGLVTAGMITSMMSADMSDVTEVSSIMVGWVWQFGIATCVGVIVSYCVTWWFDLAMIRVADGELTGTHRSMGQALGDGFRGIGSLALLATAAGLVVALAVGGMIAWMASLVTQATNGGDSSSPAFAGEVAVVAMGIMLVSLLVWVAAILLGIKLFVTFPAMAAEKLPVWHAWGRSWKLTKGAGGMIFLLQLLVGIVLSLVSQLALMPMWVSEFSTIGSMRSFGSAASLSDVLTLLAPLAVGYIVSMVLVIAISGVTSTIGPILSAIVYRDRLQKVAN